MLKIKGLDEDTKKSPKENNEKIIMAEWPERAG